MGLNVHLILFIYLYDILIGDQKIVMFHSFHINLLT